MDRKRREVKERGFTLFELIIVIVILSILAVYAGARFGTTNHDLVSQADIVKTQLRFSQLKALHDDTAPWGVVFTTNSYTLYNNGAPAAIDFPFDDSNTHTFPSGITSTVTTTVMFDSWGSPGSADVPITLSDGSGTIIITVAANTGYITP